METSAIDFAAWGLDEAWPTRRWLELIHGRRGRPHRGVRLGYASDSAMVLICTIPRDRFDEEVCESAPDPVREIAFETTYAQINLALHQIKSTGGRPDGLIGSLVRYADQQATRYPEWPTAQWGDQAASVTQLASWQSGFSAGYPGAYVIVHTCGMGLDQIRLVPVTELSRYDGGNGAEIGAMHWELWRGRPELGYDDLARTVVVH